jgi:enoyl-[acyl-carrier protein] reductase I
MSFLGISGKTFLVLGVANKKSVAWHVAKTLEAEGAKVIYSVRSAARKESLNALLAGKPTYICDLEDEAQTVQLAQKVGKEHGPIDGVLHSVAFANFSKGMQPFHETVRADFLQATAISCFSLVELSRALKPYLTKDASVVSIGISSQVTAANYGYMSPIKAALESASRFLAKSFSSDSRVRFNSVNAGPLKTSASAGIPGYLENYIHAEKMTLRKEALKTQEVADVAVWLLSPRSSGVNGQGVVVDAGMGLNFFDEELVKASSRIS